MIIEELISSDQGNAGIDQRGHITEAENLCTFDVKILRKQDNGDADNVNRNNKTDSQLALQIVIFAF